MSKATVRTYRHGLGDCHLVTLHGPGDQKFRILIDCGVILGTPDAPSVMTAVMDDVLNECGKRVDLLVATHEHWDHVSGFVQAKESFAQLTADRVWMAWTEDPQDEQAKELGGERDDAIKMLQDAAMRMQTLGDAEVPLLTSLLEFQGSAGRGTTKAGLEAVRAKGLPRYCDPKDAPFEVPGSAARIFVLGPPRDPKLLKKIRPSPREPETYSLAMADFKDSVLPSLGASDSDQIPFSTLYRIPLDRAKSEPFFQQHYWDTEDWRRIDVAWMGDATQFALALDSLTNNTSLVLAIELDEDEVLLFAADAQVGNWLSWGECHWDVNGRKVTGHDLLRRTVLYKVGHHGSYNATLKAQGLELMESLQTAVIPVDHAMALKKKWGAMPLDGLIAALSKSASGAKRTVIRTDKPLPEGVGTQVRSTELFVEVDI